MGLRKFYIIFGIVVTGSDATRSKITDRLSSRGILVTIGHDLNLVKKSDLVIYTAAIKQDDPELVEARKNSITTIERCDFVRLSYKNI